MNKIDPDDEEEDEDGAPNPGYGNNNTPSKRNSSRVHNQQSSSSNHQAMTAPAAAAGYNNYQQGQQQQQGYPGYSQHPYQQQQQQRAQQSPIVSAIFNAKVSSCVNIDYSFLQKPIMPSLTRKQPQQQYQAEQSASYAGYSDSAGGPMVLDPETGMMIPAAADDDDCVIEGAVRDNNAQVCTH